MSCTPTKPLQYRKSQLFSLFLPTEGGLATSIGEEDGVFVIVIEATNCARQKFNLCEKEMSGGNTVKRRRPYLPMTHLTLAFLKALYQKLGWLLFKWLVCHRDLYLYLYFICIEVSELVLVNSGVGRGKNKVLVSTLTIFSYLETEDKGFRAQRGFQKILGGKEADWLETQLANVACLQTSISKKADLFLRTVNEVAVLQSL